MKLRVLTLLFLICLVGFSSCRKKPEKIGNDLQPTNSLITVNFNNAQDIVTSTFNIPYLNTKNLNYAFIGNMNDPVFGSSNFDFYTQISLSTTSLGSWGDDAVADSVVLFLTYNGYYGDTTDKPLTVNVFEVIEDMYESADSSYKSNTVLQCESQDLANSYTFVPRPLTPMDTVVGRGVLRIPIDVSLGEKFINNAPYETNDDFKSFFKGLHVACEKNDIAASAVAFNLTHSYTYLRVYYHNDIDTLNYDFVINSSEVKYNHYTHDYSNSQITFNDTTNNAKLYVQGAAGTRVWVKFPKLQEWADSLNNNIAINDARLFLTSAVDVADTALYKIPSKFVAAGAKFDTDTAYVLIPDQYISSDYYGGSYNENTETVWFRITEYVQNIIRNGAYATDCDGLLIYVDQGSYVPRRWVFHGPQSDTIDKRIRLEIVYSLINE